MNSLSIVKNFSYRKDNSIEAFGRIRIYDRMDSSEIVADRLIISCGVGYQGTPYGSAVKAGADFEIIGRAIYNSENPLNEAKKAYEAIT